MDSSVAWVRISCALTLRQFLCTRPPSDSLLRGNRRSRLRQSSARRHENESNGRAYCVVMLLKEEPSRISSPVERLDHPVAEIVQCGLDDSKLLRNNDLAESPTIQAGKLLIVLALVAWLLGLDSNQQPSG
jgi:hypothetical protein